MIPLKFFHGQKISIPFEIYLELSCDHLYVVPADLIIGMLMYEYVGLLKKWFSARPDNVGDCQSSQKSYRACPIEHWDLWVYSKNLFVGVFFMRLCFFLIKKKRKKEGGF